MLPITSTPSLDIAWVLICAALVMLMQAGFCCLECGFSRSKNSINVALKNVLDFCASSAIFWAFGYAIMFGASRSGLFGTSGFCFDETSAPWAITFFLFQLVFCGTATTIVSGAVAERMRFGSYIVSALLISGVIYPVFGHWAWGGAEAGIKAGWLAKAGFLDFAGSTVVHSVGGWVSLATVLVLGPRIGRFGKHAKPMHGYNLPMSALGAFLLWFGWFGFNGGSTLKLDGVVPLVLLNTNLAAACGGLVALAVSFWRFRHANVGWVINGALAGLVGITASANIVSPAAAVAIGGIAGLLCVGATILLERLQIDDVVGAVPVHGVCGVWGTLAVALFADVAVFGTGLSRGGQLLAQLQGIGVCFVWAFGVSYVTLRLVNRWLPLRVTAEAEHLGLNVSEHGASTELIDLLTEMDKQREAGDFSRHVTVEPHTEVGQIAAEYNRVLDRVTNEIDKQRSAQTAVRAAERKYRGIFDNAVEGMFLTTVEGQYLAANPALARLYGYDTADELMSELNDIGIQLYIDPNRRTEFVTLIERQGFVTDFESEVRRRDGTLIWISENARVVCNPEGRHYEGTVVDITARRDAERELDRMHRELLDVARRAGMAEIATGVLHNVGNVLNSINVSASLAADRVRGSKVGDLEKVVELLKQHRDDLPSFLTDDEQGRRVLGFLQLLTGRLSQERTTVLTELETLIRHLDHVKTIVSMQQSYAGVAGVIESVKLPELLDDAMALNSSSFERHGIHVERECEDLPEVQVEKQKVLQILVNLLKNAKDSLRHSRPEGARMVLRVVRSGEDRVRIEVQDNGGGIAPENLARVFSHGFTTKRDGHGFGLHASANAAQEMGGSLTVESAGLGRGATFVLELPLVTVEELATV